MLDKLRKLFPHGHERYVPLTLDELTLYSKKNHDYAFGGDALGNFKRVAGFFEQYPNLQLSDPRVIALVYMMKQLDAVLWMMNCKHEAKVEGIGKRLEDIYVYAKIMRIIDEELLDEG